MRFNLESVWFARCLLLGAVQQKLPRCRSCCRPRCPFWSCLSSLMIPTAVVTPTGLLLYGISAHHKLHWIIPNVGAAIFAAGLVLSFQCAQTYIVDAYIPLFAPALYDRFGMA
ncbi:hypothetical protein BGZ61DRAFT_463092 [Ilyonectria robusta]|uniref:uncharacterized protein n=1 Tax=Ilyonectria robusta TaxID=1079257 RepID=UPI001E8EAD1E|nr:uncharacterized protein BGZ61DRAFT_463023 [Ilyonectria robusta]XP_046096543.1 uncharacterized protein BGZ61DRAFT_463092 [Ilyonectria robusta]KAH8662696.1 hypothetical protein BGZ61DRAFT_463023 [Ilyonectria robusta]KAH8662716.1 hypothetical protein BGZ61DRAFT_463092 [Ilyonectria robusta]